MAKHDECPDSYDGAHELSEVEIESSSEDSVVLLITCIHCEAVGRFELALRDIDWTAELDEEEEDDDPLRDAEED